MDESQPLKRKNDGVGDEIGSQNPGAFVLAGGEASGNVGQGDVGDGGVEHFHERSQGDRESDDPRIDRGTPGFGLIDGCGCRTH